MMQVQRVMHLGTGAWAAGAAAAALALATTSDHFDMAVHADSTLHPPASPADPTTRLKDWLVSQGASVDNLLFQASQVGQQAGTGVFVAPGKPTQHTPRRRWWWPLGAPPPHATVASFPLSAAITAANVLSDPITGPHLEWMVHQKLLDERQLVQCHLAVERARGQGSPLAPWMDSLPAEFHSPLVWSDGELSELRGTTLHRATMSLRKQLLGSWKGVQPALAALAKRLGAPRSPKVEDLFWAHCVFWSRGQSLPVPHQPGAASKLVAHLSGKPSSLMTLHEGIVPGLDFLNHHSTRATCWWEVVQQGGATSGTSPHAPKVELAAAPDQETSPLTHARVLLQLHRGAKVKPGEELSINYGDGKSNEELLMLYGFVDPTSSQDDQAMLACPVPPSPQWDDVMAARMELLTSCGMRPQFFLRSAHVTTGGKGGASEPCAPVPPEVLEALEVFVLKPEEVQARLDALTAQRRAREQGHRGAELAAPGLSGAELDLALVAKQLGQKGAVSGEHLTTLGSQLGLRMAAVSIYVRMLEVKLVELEGPQGTGTLEEDERLLAQHAASAAAAARATATPTARGTATAVPVGDLTLSVAPLPHRHWCAVVYRAGQKRLVRAHLVGARAELQSVISILAQLHDIQQAGALHGP